MDSALDALCGAPHNASMANSCMVISFLLLVCGAAQAGNPYQPPCGGTSIHHSGRPEPQAVSLRSAQKW